jgi:hypothetical protein
MPQREGETDYKYEDYASEMATHRLPQTSALVDVKLRITLDSGILFDLDFLERNKVAWQSGEERGTDWCEAVEVAPNAYFIDMTFVHQPRQTQTFIVNTETRQALSIRTIMREGDIGKDPRAVQHLTAGQSGDLSVTPTGREHAYLNAERYCWHCLVGPLKGQADVERCTVYKWDDDQYVFCWREFGLPVCTVFFYDWHQMRSTGKFFAIGDDGKLANTPAGALITKLSMAFYPPDARPL